MKPRWIIIRLVAITLLDIAWVFTSLCLAPDVYAQEQNPLSQKPSGSGHFIRRWLALGPIVEGEPAPKAIETDYLLLATGIPESKFATLEEAPKVGDSLNLTLEGYATQERIWKVLELSETGDVDGMLVAEGEVDFAVAYLITFVESKEATNRELIVVYDDLIKVWLNGEMVYTTSVDVSLMPGRARISVPLKKGLNSLMFKVADSRLAWLFMAQFAAESDLRFFDTSNRQLVSLGKRLARLPKLQLESPKSEVGIGTEGVWKTYQHLDGLAGNYVTDIIQDQQGAMWFGTQGGGVSKFDGKSWKTYTQKDGLAENNVTAIIQDKDGAIWFGTRGGGVNRFNGKSWQTYTQKDGLAGNNVFAIMQDKEGTIWFGTQDGVSKFDGKSKSKSWQTYTQKDGLAGNEVYTIMQDQEGAMWFGTRGGVSRFDGKSWKTYVQKDGLADNNVITIMQDQEGVMWFGTKGGGVSRFDGKSKIWQTYTQKDGLGDNWVLAIIQDQEGAMWFGTNGGGVNRFDDQSKTWQTYTQKGGLAHDIVNTITQDREGAIWFGTWNGVSRFDWKSWRTYTIKGEWSEYGIHGIAQDREGAVWFGTWSGTSRFDSKNKSWQTYTQKDGIASRNIFAIAQDKEGAMWFGGLWGGGVSRFDGLNWKTYAQKDGLANNRVTKIIQDQAGSMWFGTIGGGVSKFDGKSKSWQTYTRKDGLAGNDVFAIMQDQEGVMWFGTQDGVSSFDGRSWQTYTQKDGLAGKEVYAIMQDQEGVMWFGTRGGGVSRFDGRSWKIYAQKDGLADNWVLDIIQDKEGKIWFGTWGGGVNLYDGRCFQTIDSRDGLVNDSVDSIYLDRSGKVWLGTKGGAVQFTPNKIPPPLYVTQVLADEKIYSLDMRHEPPDTRHKSKISSLNLSPGVRRVAISFHAISFKTRPGGMKYFYQFVGPIGSNHRVAPTIENNWQGPVNQETVEYFNLKPGRYMFRVQAVDRDLNYSEIASLELALPLLWHQIGWIRAILVGGGLTFFSTFGFVTWRWSANRINTRRLEQRLREQEVKEAQLQMLRYQLNPHFLFNALNSIYGLITEDYNSAKRMVTELSKYLRYSLLSKNVSEVLLRDEIEMLKNYLMIEKVRFEDRLEVSFDIEASAEEYRLPALLIQPLVENAIKYGMQTSSMPLKIRIRAYIKEDCFHLEVSNTGKWQEPFEGKEAGATAMHSAGAGVGGTGIGLQNVRERLDHAYGERYRFEIFEWDGWVYAVIEIK